MSFQSRPASREPGEDAAAATRPPSDALLVFRPPRHTLRYFVLWTLFVLPLALAYGAWQHQVAWWLIAIPFLRVLNLLALTSRPWLALTRTELQGRDADLVWSFPTRQIASVRIARSDPPRIEFTDAGGRALAHAPLVFTDRQIERLVEALGVRVVGP